MAGIKKPRSSDPDPTAELRKRPRLTEKGPSPPRNKPRPRGNESGWFVRALQSAIAIPGFLIDCASSFGSVPVQIQNQSNANLERYSTRSRSPTSTGHTRLPPRQPPFAMPAQNPVVIDLTQEEDDDEVIVNSPESSRRGGPSTVAPRVSMEQASSSSFHRRKADGSSLAAHRVPGARRQYSWIDGDNEEPTGTTEDDVDLKVNGRRRVSRPSNTEAARRAEVMRVLKAQLVRDMKTRDSTTDPELWAGMDAVVRSQEKELDRLQEEEKRRRIAARADVRPAFNPSNAPTDQAYSFDDYAKLLRHRASDRFLTASPRHSTASFVPHRPVVSADKLLYTTPDDLQKTLDRLTLDRKLDDEEAQKLLGPSVPESLSAEELKVVKKTMSNAAGFRSPKVYSECIESGNMSRLRAGAWLSDDIMAFYTGLILKRNSEDDKLPDIHYFNTFFYTKLSTQGYSGLRRWTKKVDLFSKDMVLVPINVGNMHWIAAVINFKQKRFEYFDSMGDYGANMRSVFKHLRDYVLAEHKDKKGSEFDLSGWENRHNESAPRQNNGSDCGVFSCQTLELVARGADPIDKGFEFSSDNMRFFRDLMVYEITTGELKKRW